MVSNLNFSIKNGENLMIMNVTDLLLKETFGYKVKCRLMIALRFFVPMTSQYILNYILV